MRHGNKMYARFSSSEATIKSEFEGTKHHPIPVEDSPHGYACPVSQVRDSPTEPSQSWMNGLFTDHSDIFEAQRSPEPLTSPESSATIQAETRATNVSSNNSPSGSDCVDANDSHQLSANQSDKQNPVETQREGTAMSQSGQNLQEHQHGNVENGDYDRRCANNGEQSSRTTTSNAPFRAPPAVMVTGEGSERGAVDSGVAKQCSYDMKTRNSANQMSRPRSTRKRKSRVIDSERWTRPPSQDAENGNFEKYLREDPTDGNFSGTRDASTGKTRENYLLRRRKETGQTNTERYR